MNTVTIDVDTYNTLVECKRKLAEIDNGTAVPIATCYIGSKYDHKTSYMTENALLKRALNANYMLARRYDDAIAKQTNKSEQRIPTLVKLVVIVGYTLAIAGYTWLATHP